MTIVKLIAKSHLIKAVKIFGIEGTEDKIKDLYKNMPYAKSYMLQTLKEMYQYGT